MRHAVFVDALGTLLWMEPPWELLDPRLVEGIPAERVRSAFRAEMAYYRSHAHEGADERSLAELRARCAEILSARIGRQVGVEAMLAALRFHPFPDAEPTLHELADRGLALVCVSNWDCSLPGVLEAAGLAGLLDGVVTSAGAGARKPNPAIFAPALRIAGCEPSEALHIGDTDGDITAARAAGVEALLIDRSGGGDIASLSEIGKHLRR